MKFILTMLFIVWLFLKKLSISILKFYEIQIGSENVHSLFGSKFVEPGWRWIRFWSCYQSGRGTKKWRLFYCKLLFLKLVLTRWPSFSIILDLVMTTLTSMKKTMTATLSTTMTKSLPSSKKVSKHRSKIKTKSLENIRKRFG